MRNTILNAGTQEYKLKFTTYALEQLESETNVKLFAAENNGMMELMSTVKGIKNTLFWGLKTSHPEIKYEDMNELMDKFNETMGFTELGKKLSNALFNALGMKETDIPK